MMETLVTKKVSIVLQSLMTDIDIKERIKVAAHDLVMQYGIRSVSMDDIATKMGISKKTIYIYFKDKDELVDAVVETVLLKNKCSCCENQENASNAIHEIFLVMDFMDEMFNAMNPSIIHDMQKYHPVAFQRFYAHKNDFIYNMLKSNLQRGMKEELYRLDLNVEVMARFRLESMFIPFNPEFLKKVKSSLLEVEQQIIEHWVFGLVTTKGYKMVLRYMQAREKLAMQEKK